MNSLSEKIAQLREAVDMRIRETVSKDNPAGLYEPIKYLLEHGGKRLRPVLLLLSAEALGATLEKSLNAAVAVELMHNFTLVHDDIMDNDHMRRGRPTIHHKWDEGTAILAGDSLVALAYKMLLTTESPNIGTIAQVFTDGIIEVCEGQALDKEFEGKPEVALKDYIEMINKKTARLFATACELGARIADGKEEEINHLREYGAWLGRAFQIQDDLLDILSPEEISGKTFGSDIRQGKKTYLVICALNKATSAQREKLLSVLGNKNANTADILLIRDLFEELGIFATANKVVEEYLEKINKTIRILRPSPAKAYLEEIPQLLVARRS